MPTVIDTSTRATATAYSNQRKVDRCQNGVLWAFFTSELNVKIEAWYSADDGATWTFAGTVNAETNNNSDGNFSIFIDLDDYCHIVWKEAQFGYIYYMRGTPNAARTAWTWSAAQTITTLTNADYPDLVACRTPGTSPTEWDVFIVASSPNYPLYERIHINSAGTMTLGNYDGLSVNNAMGQLNSAEYGNSVYKWASIDFHHTGDGKTVKDGTPHVFVAWSAGATGAGKGIRFKKGAYSSGTWTWGAEQELDSTVAVNSVSRWLNCLFDGARIIIGWSEGGRAGIIERNVADTASNELLLLSSIPNSDQFTNGSMTYDSDGNIYLIGNSEGSLGSKIGHYAKWDRATATLGPLVSFDSSIGNAYVSAKRGSSHNLIEFVYTDGTASPYNIVHDAVVLNVAPDAPTITAPTEDAVGLEGMTLSWTHNDPESDVQSGWAVKRREYDGINYGTPEWWNETGRTVVNSQSVDTSTAAIATAYSSQRKLGRTSNGVLWAAHLEDSNNRVRLLYSTDDGVTWTEVANIQPGASPQILSAKNFSLFIDIDDYLHLTWKQHGAVSSHSDYSMADSVVGYLRGTPNAARTAWTWSAATDLGAAAIVYDYPDVVAHREGAGWKAHVVMSRSTSSNPSVMYRSVTITSGGGITADGSIIGISAAYNNTIHAFPSIDFNHTGDGKTVAGGTPHLYVGWSAGAAGTGNGIRFKKATYSAGTWTWGTEQQIDTALYYTSDYVANCMFDGVRVIIAGMATTGTAWRVIAHERDAADTASVVRNLLTMTSSTNHTNFLALSSATYDSAGNIYIFGRAAPTASAPYYLNYRKWTRATGTLEPLVTIDNNVPSDVYPSVSRGSYSGRIEFIYADGAASAYTTRYGSVQELSGQSWVGQEVVNAGATASTVLTGWSDNYGTYEVSVATADARGLGNYSSKLLNPYQWWRAADNYQEDSTPVEIATSTTATATAYSNQRKIDRCQNGVLWAVHSIAPVGANGTQNAYRLWYSTDNGATWLDGGYIGGVNNATANHVANASLFIDLDDYAHIVYKDHNNGYIYYQRGTPNAARTAWTWSAAVLAGSYNGYDYPDIVAFRTPGSSPTEWEVYIVASAANSTTTDRPVCVRFHISNDGTVSAAIHDPGTGTVSSGVATLSSSVYGNTNHKWPSIDFNHTGDGKTVAGGTPHIYAAWSAGTSGAGKGIRFKKATYSGGTWTWDTEREIDSTRYVEPVGMTGRYSWLNCLFDGTRVILGGSLYNTSTHDLMLYERDVADTTTTTRTLATATFAYPDSGSMTYDGSANVYFFGRNYDASNEVIYRKWTRSTTTLGANVVVDSTNVKDTPWVSATRGPFNSRIEWVYTDGTVSPYSIKYSSVSDIVITEGWATEETWNRSVSTQVTIPAAEFESGREYAWSVATGD